MLSKAHRLVTADFDAVMEKGKVTHSPLFVMRHVENSAGTRISAVVPHKVGKTAVIRNSMRRKMYEAITMMPISAVKSVHGIVFAKAQALTAQKDALEKDMQDLFVKASLLR